MRIGIITGEYPPMEGGVGAFTQELGLALHAQGHEVHILTTALPEAPTITADGGLSVYHQIKTWNWGVHKRITRWIKTLALNVVNIQYEAAAYQMKSAITLYPCRQGNLPAPIVVTYHDLLPPYLFPKAGPLRPWTVQQLARCAGGIIVTNDGDSKSLARQLGEHSPPIRMIPIGSNIAPTPPPDYTSERWRAERGFKPDDLLIGFFGFLNRSKGIETLVEAVAQLAQDNLPVHLLFIGGRTGSSDITNTQYADEVDTLIAKVGIGDRVHRTGFAEATDVSAALLAIDVCALPYREGASLRHGTLHAALAHGCAIITTRPPDETPQLCNGQNVCLIAPENAATLTDALRTLWADAHLRRQLGQAAASLAQEFSWDRIAARTVTFFQELSKT